MKTLLLLKTGFDLTGEMIAQLVQKGIRHAWIQVPGFEEVEKHVGEQIARCHMDLYRVLSASIEQFEHRVSIRLDVPAYRQAVHNLLVQII